MIAEREQLKALIKECLEECLATYLQGLLTGEVSSPEDEYLPTKKAVKVLGYANSRQLYRAVKSGLFRLGIEVQDRRPLGATAPRFYFHLENCKARLNGNHNHHPNP